MVGARKRVEDADSAEQVIHSSLSLLMGLDMAIVYSVALDSCLAVRGLIALCAAEPGSDCSQDTYVPPLFSILSLSGTLSHFILG